MQRLGVFSSRFFWKLFLTYSILFAALTFAIGYQVYQQFEAALTHNLHTSLHHKIELLVPYAEQWLGPSKPKDFEMLIKRLGLNTETRITVIDPTGKVISDSDHDVETMDNHASRPELLQAAVSTYGTNERWSSTLKSNLVYMARSITKDGKPIGFLRVAYTRETLDRDLNFIRDRIILAALIGIAIALLIAFFIARRVAIPIAEMMVVCDAMRRGQYEEKVRTITHDEIGKLGDTLNRLGSEITTKISQISLERAQLKTMLTGMVEGIIAVDNEDRVRFCNRAAYILLGSNLTDCRGMRLSDVPGFDQLTEVAHKARVKRELIEEEVSFEAESFSRLLELHASFFEGIDASGVIIVLHDITKVRNLEKMRRDFVANVSHEIKTPLTSIKGYVETLRLENDVEPNVQQRFLEKIERNADRLMKLVQDILSLAQIESQEGDMPLKPTDVGVITRQVINQYEDQVAKKELEVVVKEFTKPLIVMADKEALFQVLDNLYTNAVRYTPHGGKINIVVRETATNGVVEVKDTGIGIPKKYLARIFERFYRVDKARSRELGGTGLGLSIVKHLIASMRGTIAVESEVGMGSKFTISLPLAR